MRFDKIMLVAILAVLAAYTQAAEPRRVALADPSLVETEYGRMLVKYLASCALGKDVVLVVESAESKLEFPGAMALAPHWHERALSAEEERWVSACILARTNFYGTRVQISQRSPFPAQAPGLQWDEEESHRFPLEEATFFGNIFRGERPAYVCGPSLDEERQARVAAHARICTLPLEGREHTACGFIHVGACTPAAFTQRGVEYRE